MVIDELYYRFNEAADIEVYAWNDDSVKRLHTDYITYIEDYDVMWPVSDYFLLSEAEYNYTVLANDALVADYNAWYGNKNALTLVVIVAEKYKYTDRR